MKEEIDRLVAEVMQAYNPGQARDHFGKWTSGQEHPPGHGSSMTAAKPHAALKAVAAHPAKARTAPKPKKVGSPTAATKKIKLLGAPKTLKAQVKARKAKKLKVKMLPKVKSPAKTKVAKVAKPTHAVVLKKVGGKIRMGHVSLGKNSHGMGLKGEIAGKHKNPSFKVPRGKVSGKMGRKGMRPTKGKYGKH